MSSTNSLIALFMPVPVRQDGRVAAPELPSTSRFSPALMHTAARLYYLEDAKQADVARRMGISRPTVSRLLSEARREGIVRIEVVAPVDADLGALGHEAARLLGLERVHLSALPTLGSTGEALAPALSTALLEVGLDPGDVLLVSSGRTVHEAAQAALPPLPGVLLVPTIGGQDEPEPWYATNEITRQVALKVGGAPAFLHSPALPSPDLYATLQGEAAFRRVLELWSSARCAVVGIGAPPLTRTSLPEFVPGGSASLREAVGDVCSRFYDREGREVPFPGSERLVATRLETLRELPTCIGLAAGFDKVPSILSGARGGYFNQLVTDAETAAALVAAVAAQ